MNHWLGIALVAYLIGAAIEGISAANQLVGSTPELARKIETEDTSDSSGGWWRMLIVVISVSLCGACFWPCRLIHRALKEGQSCQSD
jgi:hypothetical protein